MDDQRRFFLTSITVEVCSTLIKLAVIAAIVFAFRSQARGGERVTFDPFASPITDKSSAESTTMIEVPAVGHHIHRCPAGHEWSHADSSKGDRSAHTCPECGALSWNPVRTGVRLVSQVEPPPRPSAVARGNSPTFTIVRQGNCPGGQCPTRRSP